MIGNIIFAAAVFALFSGASIFALLVLPGIADRRRAVRNQNATA